MVHTKRKMVMASSTTTTNTTFYTNDACNIVNLLIHFIILGKEKLP